MTLQQQIQRLEQQLAQLKALEAKETKYRLTEDGQEWDFTGNEKAEEIDTVSLAEMGARYYLLNFANTVSRIHEYTNDDPEVIQSTINSLITKGFVEIDKD